MARFDCKHYEKYKHLLTDPIKNLEFRKELIRFGDSSPQAAGALWKMCAEDPLFYINAFVFTYDPRITECTTRAFNTYEFQNEAILELLDAITDPHDILIKKSRTMGASWLCIFVFEYMWHFRRGLSFCMISEKETLVDMTANPIALFWKIDFIHENLPVWLVPRTIRQKLTLKNVENGSVITGSATTKDAARGGRNTAMLLDEFAAVTEGQGLLAATQANTYCRIFNSTPQGINNAFYDMTQRPIKQLRMHWTAHPIYSQGLIIDENGKPWSPWYQIECDRAPNKMLIAQELDIEFHASDSMFFDMNVIEELQADCIRPPFVEGHISCDKAIGKFRSFEPVDGGPMKLWIQPDGAGRLPEGMYAMGIDISQGTGASNSCLSVADRSTGEKVAEYATPNLPPSEFAGLCVAVARWFGGEEACNMIWESNGPGRPFEAAVYKTGFSNIYFERNEKKRSKKRSDIPGWASNKQNKFALLSELLRAEKSREFINRSQPSLDERKAYVFRPGNTVEHSRAANMIDPSGAGDNHGDRVIADALCWKGVQEFNRIVRFVEPEIPEGCMEYRRMTKQAEMRREADVYA